MVSYLFDTPEIRSIPVGGQIAEYPVHRIFCVGRNYEAHAKEMGNEVDREAPFYFTKQLHAVQASRATIPYPPATSNYHYEMELVFVIGAPVFRCSVDAAAAAIYAYGCGLDMTRRDLQAKAKEGRRPWCVAKDIENGAVLAPLTLADDFGTVADQRIHLSVNGEVRQDAVLSDMIHNCAEIVADLSKHYHLKPGDVVMTGTPAGVGAVQAGDVLEGGIDGLEPVALTIGAAEAG